MVAAATTPEAAFNTPLKAPSVNPVRVGLSAVPNPNRVLKPATERVSSSFAELVDTGIEAVSPDRVIL
jgi:hypothetical protein